MFKDIRLKKSHNNSNGNINTINVKNNVESTSNKQNLQQSVNIGTTLPVSFNPHASINGRKSVDSDTSIDSLLNGIPMIKGTLTHEWGNSSAKKKTSDIIKLNNEDGTPLTSPIQLTKTESPPETLYEDSLDVINNNTKPSIPTKVFVDKKKRETNRAARILSNDQFLNIDVLSSEDKKLIEKINNGKIYESPKKKREMISALMSKASFSSFKEASSEDDNYTVSFSKKEKRNLNKNSKKKTTSIDFKKQSSHKNGNNNSSNNINNNSSSNNSSTNNSSSGNNRSRSVSTTESINSESSDVSATSQFSFQFTGRNSSVKYYSKNNPKDIEMMYFDDLYEHEVDVEDDGINEEDMFDDESDDDDVEEFGNGFSNIALISEEEDEEDNETKNEYGEEEDFNEGKNNNFECGFSNLSSNSEDENEDTIDGDILKRTTTGNTLKYQDQIINQGTYIDEDDDEEIVNIKNRAYRKQEEKEEEEEDDLLTPIANENGNKINSFKDLFDISDDEDEINQHDITPKAKKTAVSTLSSYNDLFDLSDPDDFDESVNENNISRNNELIDYTNDSDLEKLIEEMDESLNVEPTSQTSTTYSKEPPSRGTSPLFSNLLRSPKPQSKKNFGYTQFYGKNSISAIYNDPIGTASLVQSPNSTLVNLPPRNILKYHDLSTNLDSNIPGRMGELFFIDEEEEEEIPSNHKYLSDYCGEVLDDDLILDEINEIPEDYDDSDDAPSLNDTNGILYQQSHSNSISSNFSKKSYTSYNSNEKNENWTLENNNNNNRHNSANNNINSSNNSSSSSSSNNLINASHKTKSPKYSKLFQKSSTLVARNDKPQNNKMSIKTKTITFFKRHNYNDNTNNSKYNNNSSHSRSGSKTPPRIIAADIDLSPIQERRGSIEE
ncbi:hypothetical protein HANVADRAFT_1764 [Hanseniaspora valbyensis NRRL Y-1626]|uniref:Uncharacterized protein n=1 Tax=Hanseniaspora valbyensis NRRL Y-1626 TaxID=766949 RepID=A0A1B7TFM3_9ASCO|nr:hypothetical protein HANVADRAFT_1764 [Hanseniaspora valbyensis NRRL Y-1626]